MLARHVPVTRPTYPQPITVTSILEVSKKPFPAPIVPHQTHGGVNAGGPSLSAIRAPAVNRPGGSVAVIISPNGEGGGEGLKSLLVPTLTPTPSRSTGRGRKRRLLDQTIGPERVVWFCRCGRRGRRRRWPAPGARRV